MKWPWVSRGRFDDAQARIAALEAERKELVDELMELRIMPAGPASQGKPASPRQPRTKATIESIEAAWEQAVANGDIGTQSKGMMH